MRRLAQTIHQRTALTSTRREVSSTVSGTKPIPLEETSWQPRSPAYETTKPRLIRRGNKGGSMRRTILLAVSVCLFVGVGLCQSSITISSDSSDLSRPISTLIDQIRERQKLSVTYEDPRYSNSADIEDITAKVASDPSEAVRSGHRTLIPKGRAISFVYAPKDFSSPQQ